MGMLHNSTAGLRHAGLTVNRYMILVVTMMLTAALPASEAQAQSRDNKRGSIVISNPTDKTLRYQFRWGSGPWERFSVPPRSFNSHSHELDRKGHAPYRWIRFDNIGGDDRVTWREYRLDFYSVALSQRGKPYYFKYAGNRLDLHKPTSEQERAFFNSLTYKEGKWTAIIPESWRK